MKLKPNTSLSPVIFPRKMTVINEQSHFGLGLTQINQSRCHRHFY